MYVQCMHGMLQGACGGQRITFRKSVLSSFHMGSEDETQLIRLEGHLYLLSHLHMVFSSYVLFTAVINRQGDTQTFTYL